MATNLHDEFENEIDLSNEFENEQEYVAPDLLEKVSSGLQQTAKNQAETLAPVVETIPALASNVQDFGTGAASGLTFGGLDEIGGALSAPVEALYNKFNPTDEALREQGFQIEEPGLAELYRDNQQMIQDRMSESEERSPWLYGAGQIAGGITSAPLIASASGIGAASNAPKILDIAKTDKIRAGIELLKRGGTTYAKALPAIMAESALSSKEGGLEEGKRGQLAEDVVGGALFGLPTVMGLQGASDLLAPGAQKLASSVGGKFKEAVEASPLMRQMKVSYDYGKSGIDPKSTKVQLGAELGKTNLAELDNTRVNALMAEIYKSDEKIGRAVGQSLENATAAGKVVNLSPDAQQSLTQLQNIAQKYPELADNTKVMNIFGKITETKGQVSPLETRELIDYVDAYINKFKAATNKTPLEESILSNLIKTRKDFSTTLKTAIPEYAQAAERMASFRKLVPETIIARARPVEVTENYFGNLRNQDQKLFDPLKALMQGTTKQGSGTAETRTAFVNMIKGMKEFEQGEGARLASGEIAESALKRPVSAIEEQIKKYSDDAVARGSMDAISPQTGIGGISREAMLGAGAETGRSMALTAANKAGLFKNYVSQKSVTNPVAKLGRGLYNAPNESVDMLATKLKQVPGLEKYGNTLSEAIKSGNNNRKNQALFTIMQNPSARAVVGTEEDEN